MEKSHILANAVLTKSTGEVDALYKTLGYVENSSRALGFACRFCGLDYVRVLVENGATFRFVWPEGRGSYYKISYWLSPLEMTKALHAAYIVTNDPCFENSVIIQDRKGVSIRTLNVLPIDERVEIVKYLYENRERVEFDAGELLFYSIISGSQKITAALKELGAKFTENRIAVLTEGGRSFDWQEYCTILDTLGDDEFLDVMGSIVEEVGGKTLHYTESVYWANYNPHRKRFRLFKPEFFKFILENFNQKKMNKTQTMKAAIDMESVQCLKLCAENGWLKAPKKRDEMIQYATETGKTECTAFLLDFKNRTADLVAEQIKAEKKMLAELNADPNSVTELKKIWSYEKLDDGTLRITSYKGNRGDVEVPREIGKSAVTEIGAYAFSPGAPRLRTERCNFRRNEIKSVVLPDTVTVIGKGAFNNCQGLERVNIPDGVTEIGASAFGVCRNVTEFVIPASVKAIGDSAFTVCQSITGIIIPEGVPEIGDCMFSGCRSLKTAKLPDTVEKIGIWAFHGCSSLTEIVIPEGVTEIGRQAFIRCDSLKTVVLPASVKKIKNYKYRDRAPEHIFSGLTEVTVIVEPKSYAEKYCKRNEINYGYREDK